MISIFSRHLRNWNSNKTLHQKRLVHYLDQFWLSFISNRSQNYVRTTTHTQILIITIITQLHQWGLFKFIWNYCLCKLFFFLLLSLLLNGLKYTFSYRVHRGFWGFFKLCIRQPTCKLINSACPAVNINFSVILLLLNLSTINNDHSIWWHISAKFLFLNTRWTFVNAHNRNKNIQMCISNKGVINKNKLTYRCFFIHLLFSVPHTTTLKPTLYICCVLSVNIGIRCVHTFSLGV